MDTVRGYCRRQSNRLRVLAGKPPIIPPEEQDDRFVYAQDAEAVRKFCDNTVVTSKYTWYNFIPLFLFEQFTRFANAYFLMVSILQTIPEISITDGVPTNFLPLSIVLGFDGIVTAREDYKRHVDDHKANSSKTLAMRNGNFREIQWREVLVGDILKIRRNEAVPADCVFLSAYSPDAHTPDTCYVQTAQLDGETNLKLRQALPATVERFQSDNDCATFRGYIRCEPPTASFEKFVGTFHFERPLAEGTVAPGLKAAASPVQVRSPLRAVEERTPSLPLPLEAEQTLLRGSIIRNVDYVYAMVVYSGRECKVRVRQTSRVLKRAQVELQINRFSMILLAVLIAFCINGTAVSARWLSKPNALDPFMEEKAGFTPLDGIRQTFTYFLLNAGFIPVSLYVTVRLARSLQMWFMEKDNEMFHHEPALVRATNGLEGQYPFNVRTMDLNDELGQISHIFSDKTGTLTLNYMEFRKFMVRGVAYGLGTTQIGIDRMRREGLDVRHLELQQQHNNERRVERVAHVNFEDGSDTHAGRSVSTDLRNPSDNGQGTAIHDFMLHLVLNHTVLPEVVRDNDGNIIGSRLSASSPDEEAFLCAAETFGYKFVRRTPDTIFVDCRFPSVVLPFRTVPQLFMPSESVPGVEAGKEIPFKILHILAYSQERKRMSVIVEHPLKDANGNMRPGGGDIYLYCKGADSVILPRLFLGSDAEEVAHRRKTKDVLAQWGSDGLRTLVFAYKPLQRDDFMAWSSMYTRACSDIEQIRLRKSKQPNKIEELMDSIERDLYLQGATANEDKLQPEVPETINILSQAGVKVWMVTGDKQETAVNIGFATRLLDTNMRQIVATAESAGSVKSGIQRIRIAAKRMHQEKIHDASSAQNARNAFENGLEWVWKQLDALESSLGFSAPQQEHVLPGDRARSNTSVSMLAGLRRWNSTTEKPVIDDKPVRPRGESFESEEGEADTSDHTPIPGVPHPTHRADAFTLSAGSTSIQVAGRHTGLASPRPLPVDTVQRTGDAFLADIASPLLGSTRRPYALVIDEPVLDAALSHERSKAYLLYVAVNCSAVICCRARPDQKARVVKLIREGVPSSRTLAVGDGANDVDMIRQAHVGVGISGAEGMQAANASDYAIGRFRFLQRLLLVHGRWNYTRMSRLVLYTFYKNLVFVCAQYWYSFQTGFSGQKFYIEYGNQTYNLIYTSLPLLLMAIFDRDVSDVNVLRFPQLYDHGRLNKGLNVRVFLSWFTAAVLESVMITEFVRQTYVSPDPYPPTPYVFQLGTVVFTCVLGVVSLRIAVEMNCHFWFFQILTAGSALIWIPLCYFFDAIDNDDMEGGMRYVFGSAACWFTIFLVLGIAAARLIAWKAYKRLYKPQLRHIVQEAQCITHDYSSVEAYCHAVDISRKTGKRITDVLQAAELANVAAQAIQVRLGRGEGAAPYPASPIMQPLPSTAKRTVTEPLHLGDVQRPGRRDIRSVDTTVLERALFRARPRLPTDSPSAYDPAEDFDRETSDERAFSAEPSRGNAGLYADMQKSGMRVPRAHHARFFSHAPWGHHRDSDARSTPQQPKTASAASSVSRTPWASDGVERVVSPLRGVLQEVELSRISTELDATAARPGEDSASMTDVPPHIQHGHTQSRYGGAMTADALTSEYVAAHYSAFGPHSHPKEKDDRDQQPQK